MKFNANSGWLMSLREGSNWGSVDSFLRDVSASKTPDGKYILESDVWGRVNAKELVPQAGHGIAFYHSTRAVFPAQDRHGRKPRVTLIGELLDAETDGREVTHIKVAIEETVLNLMSKQPLVRDESTTQLFEGCGIKQGSVATFYYAAPEYWKQLVDLVR